MMGQGDSQAPPVVATIGAFDGLHRGHQLLIGRVRERAAEASAAPTLVTFDPHPDALLRHPPLIAQLTPCPEKLRRLRALGIAEPLVLAFTRGLAEAEPEAFIRDELLPRLRLRGLVIGYDFRFGRRGGGDAAQLTEIGRRAGFWVEQQPAVCWNGAPISSTRIRAALGDGDVAAAATMLGRPYAVSGAVTSGQGLGSRELVPTANLTTPAQKLLPAPGVYLVSGGPPPADWGGVAHVGAAPTVGRSEAHQIEAHWLDFGGDLRGQQLEVRFLERLRKPVRFPDLAALRDAIAADVDRARRRLAERPPRGRGASARENGLANAQGEC
ncbi:MAG: riboflavin biosynthesis protein RibF [Candidatus Eisenbacteria bacterium]|nr:riboflavin biosynthesis protein RibF [Candidatus Eisenbacteria bacterium]